MGFVHDPAADGHRLQVWGVVFFGWLSHFGGFVYVFSGVYFKGPVCLTGLTKRSLRIKQGASNFLSHIASCSSYGLRIHYLDKISHRNVELTRPIFDGTVLRIVRSARQRHPKLAETVVRELRVLHHRVLPLNSCWSLRYVFVQHDWFSRFLFVCVEPHDPGVGAPLIGIQLVRPVAQS